MFFHHQHAYCLKTTFMKSLEVTMTSKKNTKVLLHLSRPAGCCPSANFFLLLWHHMTSCDFMVGRQMMSYMTPRHHKQVHGEVWCDTWHKDTFFTGWPWPLTYELDLRTRPDYIKVKPSAKFRNHPSNGSTVRALTDTHTDRLDHYYNLDR